MFLQRGSWLCGLALVLGVALTAMPARAADVDKYLPDDTEVVVTVNIKQVLDSGLFKKFGLEQAKQAIKDLDDVGSVLKDLGFDPFKDVDHIVIGSAGGEDPEKILFIVHGNYDLAKFKAKGEDAAKTNGDILKIHKREKGPVIYEVKLPDQEQNLFVALVDKNTLLVSPGKDYVIDALKKADNQKATVKNKDIATLIGRMDGKQSLSIALVGSALTKSGDDLGKVLPKELLEQLDAIGGGITVDDDIKLEIVVTAKTADAAKDMNKKISDGLNQALAFVAPLAQVEKNLQPAVDIIKGIKTTTKDKSVTIKGEVTPEQIEKLVKGIQALIPN